MITVRPLAEGQEPKKNEPQRRVCLRREIVSLIFQAIFTMLITLAVVVGLAVFFVWAVNADWKTFKLDHSFGLPKSFWILTFIVLTIFGLFYCQLLTAVTPFDLTLPTISISGQFGDSFGVLTSLFSTLGFGVVVVTLYEQRKQFYKQQFETSFFELLSLHNEIVNSMVINVNVGHPVTGRSCFANYYDVFNDKYQKTKDKLIKHDAIIYINAAYRVFFSDAQPEIGPYFRNLFNILKFVHNSQVDEKKMYVNFIRSQMSTYQLAVLFYNCLSINGVEKFKPLIEHYEFFEDMDFDLLLDFEHVDLYAPKAFGKTFTN